MDIIIPLQGLKGCSKEAVTVTMAAIAAITFAQLRNTENFHMSFQAQTNKNNKQKTGSIAANFCGKPSNR